jgi:glycogen debranching enzyme
VPGPLGTLANLANTVVIKEGNLFLVSLPDGGLPAAEPHPLGLWYRDCRFLSAHELRIAGAPPRLLVASDARGRQAVHELTNPELQVNGRLLPAQSLRVRLERAAEPLGVLRERLTVRSYHRGPVRLPLELVLRADFEPMLAVRGLLPRAERPPARFGPRGFEAVGRDGVRRRTILSVKPAPATAEDGVLIFELELEPGAVHEIEVEFTVSEEDPAAPPVRRSRAPELEGATATSDDQLFDRILRRCMLDLDLLRSELDGHSYFAAGVPWYATLFGRDSLIAGLQTLSFVPGIAEETLRLLASQLGREVDDERDEEPGKVLHELRVGEPATLGETAFARYYGTSDATPLFLTLLARHADWSGSLALFRELRPAVDAALQWIDRHGDLDGDGLVEYSPRSRTGLSNHGWKDSRDGVPDERGEPLSPPVALIEVQGYVICAKHQIARLFERDGDAARAERLCGEARQLEQALERFWVSDHGCYAIGLDGEKRPGAALASNQGHLLWASAVTEQRARCIRDMLLGGAMFSGWGVRTLAEGHPAYNPVGYHTGSVWPHDSAMIAVGLRRYGYDEDFMRIFEGLLEAASCFGGYRLPELFAGSPRGDLDTPVPYPVACQPQAWAAGAIPYLLGSGLGLSPDALERRLLVVRPSLPRWLGRVDVRGLQVAGATIDLRFERTGEQVTLADARIEGDVEVVLEIAGDRRRLSAP